MTFCFQCGKEVPPGNKFCPNCGTEVIRIATKISEITPPITTIKSPLIDPRPQEGSISPPTITPPTAGQYQTILRREEVHENHEASKTSGNTKILDFGIIVAFIVILLFFRGNLFVALVGGLLLGGCWLFLNWQRGKTTNTKTTTNPSDPSEPFHPSEPSHPSDPQKSIRHIIGPNIQNMDPRKDDHRSTGKEPEWVSQGIRGTVRMVREDIEEYPGGFRKKSRLLTFRLERTDSSGSILEVIPVEAARKPEKGGENIQDGDVVSIKGTRDKYGLFKAQKIFSHATNLEFQSIKVISPLGFIGGLFYWIIVLLLVPAFFGIFIGLWIISSGEIISGLVIIISCIGIFAVYIAFRSWWI